MKRIMGWAIATALLAMSISNSKAQSTNKVDYLRLDLDITLIAEMNRTPDTNGNIITVHEQTVRLSSSKIVRLLSGKVVFPIGHIIDGSGVPRPHLGAGVMTNYSANARLI